MYYDVNTGKVYHQEARTFTVSYTLRECTVPPSSFFCVDRYTVSLLSVLV